MAWNARNGRWFCEVFRGGFSPLAFPYVVGGKAKGEEKTFTRYPV
jgi:hypothetical protein